MTTRVCPSRIGLIVGCLTGGLHLAWAVIVAIGLAQPLIDFIFWMHFIKPVYAVEPFDIGTAAVLVGLTAAFGYIMGWVFGVLWNKMQGGS